MPCCDTILHTFNSQTTTTVADSRPSPFVEVLYLRDGLWVQQGVMTQVKVTPGTIFVDHGGTATGVIKISG